MKKQSMSEGEKKITTKFDFHAFQIRTLFWILNYIDPSLNPQLKNWGLFSI